VAAPELVQAGAGARFAPDSATASPTGGPALCRFATGALCGLTFAGRSISLSGGAIPRVGCPLFHVGKSGVCELDGGCPLRVEMPDSPKSGSRGIPEEGSRAGGRGAGLTPGPGERGEKNP